MFTVHATKKLLDRVKQPVEEAVAEPSTALGNWYATALFWRPQAALFVNERTLLPVFVPLAPAAKVASRLPDQLGRLLDVLEIPLQFTLQETAAMETVNFAKTANRSVVGSMNDFVFLAEHYLADGFPTTCLLSRSGWRVRRAGRFGGAPAFPTSRCRPSSTRCSVAAIDCPQSLVRSS